MSVTLKKKHPFGLAELYEIVCVPTPATAGLKKLPLTPVPPKPPPGGVAPTQSKIFGTS